MKNLIKKILREELLKEEKVVLEIAENLKITIDTQSISREKSLIKEKS